MNKVEVIKQEKDGLDVWEDVLQYAKSGFDTIAQDDFVRMRWYGIYQQRPNEGHFMMRIKLAGGIASNDQLRVLAQITDQYARGIADVTTRQTIQWHWLTIQDLPDIIARLQAVGITTAGACGDIPRNLVSCPVAGLHPNEVFDVRAEIASIHTELAGNREFSNLPRKYKLSVTGCPDQCCQPEIHDFSLIAVIDPDTGDKGYTLMVGGGLSTQPHFAQRIDAFFTPDQAVAAARAVTAVFRDFGYREKRTHARLKYLMADWGAEKFKEKLVEYLGFTPRPGVAEDTPGNVFRDHVGVHRQKQPGLNWIGLSVLTGRVTGTQLHQLADIAARYGNGEIRTTHMQNLLLPNVPDENVDLAQAALAEAGFVWDAHPVRRGAIACTGTEFCNLAITETKGRMIQIVSHLEKRVTFDRNIRINMNGCPNSCAQHSVGDIGLQGCLARVATGEKVEAYDIHLGGALGVNRSFTHAIHRKVPADKVQYAIENLLKAFNETRQGEEEFNTWTRRHDDAQLDGYLGVETIIGDPDTKEVHDDLGKRNVPAVA
ncbi:MAG: nitrite/sulfite reductase [Cytophagales bacterium]|nr:nitrite/sulfite reductase [Armatimonadota bacterium]